MSQPYHDLLQLEPKPLWRFFSEICSIPHPSKHEEALATHIVNFAKKKGFFVTRDSVGNVIIKKPATKGMEDRAIVAIQAHIDMVPQKNDDTDHDFVKDPIQAYVDGDWVTAKGTTLGADNGMGMASCLAILDSSDIPHGPLEVLLTIDEEAGMTGAFGLETGYLDAKILLNTDSEQEGEIYMGCAGGVDASIKIQIEREPVNANAKTFKLTLKGLRGGHSGVDIHTGRANANKLLARFLAHSTFSKEIQLVAISGGTLRNAIPREAYATISVPNECVASLQIEIDAFLATLNNELNVIEKNIQFFATECDSQTAAMSTVSKETVLSLMNACPNGVIRMSDDIKGVVETSLNMGVVTCTDSQVEVLCLIRSLIDSGRSDVQGMLSSLTKLAGANVTFSGAYPGWKPDPESKILHIFRDMYEQTYGHKPHIMVIHAGLECGLFKEPYPDMDMISFGPTIKFPHSPEEKVEIKSVGQYWQQLCGILAHIPKA
ncbi:Aminoacyl-histidine dipeptidase (Peptidase D) [Pseudoalteromonas luteoviolacea B = ATCC 29581]|nr:Aminoacyl-histidine dipeptidase (Peptidase D) [Pseudoalteromonas luteoviolacea B = ATCC 29581]